MSSGQAYRVESRGEEGNWQRCMHCCVLGKVVEKPEALACIGGGVKVECDI